MPDMQSVFVFAGLTWAADSFWCDGWPGDAVPLLSGGILALTRRWWQFSGGLGPTESVKEDVWLQGWGGENLDQSLRTWLCGGEIRAAQNSRVAHLWRDQGGVSVHSRAPGYVFSEAQALRNRLRAAEAWLGPWASKTRSFPEFREHLFHSKRKAKAKSLQSLQRVSQSVTEVSEDSLKQSLHGLRELQRQLRCAPFEAYVKRFQTLFELVGMLPQAVFHLQLVEGGQGVSHVSHVSHVPLCLTADPYRNFRPFLSRCIRGLTFQRWQFRHPSGPTGPTGPRSDSETQETQEATESDMSDAGQRTSLLKLWDYDVCLAWYGADFQASLWLEPQN